MWGGEGGGIGGGCAGLLTPMESLDGGLMSCVVFPIIQPSIGLFSMAGGKVRQSVKGLSLGSPARCVYVVFPSHMSRHAKISRRKDEIQKYQPSCT